MLRACVAQLLALDSPPARIAHTGDLTDPGPGEYAHQKEVLCSLKARGSCSSSVNHEDSPP
jgi:hypothetical protein